MIYVEKQNGDNLLLQSGSFFLLQASNYVSWLVHFCRTMTGVG